MSTFFRLFRYLVTTRSTTSIRLVSAVRACICRLATRLRCVFIRAKWLTAVLRPRWLLPYFYRLCKHYSLAMFGKQCICVCKCLVVFSLLLQLVNERKNNCYGQPWVENVVVMDMLSGTLPWLGHSLISSRRHFPGKLNNPHIQLSLHALGTIYESTETTTVLLKTS